MSYHLSYNISRKEEVEVCSKLLHRVHKSEAGICNSAVSDDFQLKKAGKHINLNHNK